MDKEKRDRMSNLSTEIAALKNIWMSHKDILTVEDRRKILGKYKESYREMRGLIRERMKRG